LIYGMYHTAETFFGFIFWFIPYWSWIKLGLFVWLLLPQFNGSRVVYESVLSPFMKQHKELFQNWIAKARNEAQNAASVAYKEATDP